MNMMQQMSLYQLMTGKPDPGQQSSAMSNFGANLMPPMPGSSPPPSNNGRSLYDALQPPGMPQEQPQQQGMTPQTPGAPQTPGGMNSSPHSLFDLAKIMGGGSGAGAAGASGAGAPQTPGGMNSSPHSLFDLAKIIGAGSKGGASAAMM